MARLRNVEVKRVTNGYIITPYYTYEDDEKRPDYGNEIMVIVEDGDELDLRLGESISELFGEAYKCAR